MRIKRLEVAGFKSFCDRTVLQFNNPITGVVGPNGCGKSNIVDAIRWCMGEQSAKHLRGKSMDDVIFSGSDSRGPLGMCEVTLVFENDGRVPLEYLAYSEIAVTRKLYRDGTSEYFLNKVPCRLRDVTDFFLGTGIGAKAYSIIEQGRVGMIVSSKPEDRRFLIEEAAGITKYKLKKKAAEKKMEATRQNLLRVSDVVAEIEKQLGSLRRQAQKAERYKQYKAELKDIELWNASQKWLGITAEERVTAIHQEALTLAKETTQGDLFLKESEIESARLHLAHEEGRLTELQQSLYELDNRIHLGEAEADHASREARQLLERGIESEAEIALLGTQSGDRQAEIDAAQAEQSTLTELVRGLGTTQAAREEELRLAKESFAEGQRATDGVRNEIAECKGEIVQAEGDERQAVRSQTDFSDRRARVVEEALRTQERQEFLRKETARLTIELADLKQLKLDLASEQTRSEARVRELKMLLTDGEVSLAKLSEELHLRRSRRASLEEIHARYEGFANGTRAIMKENQPRWGVVGLVADLVDAPPQFEAAVEALLGERLGAVVTETQDAGVDAISFLKDQNQGRASFIPLNRFREAGEPSTETTLEGTKGRLLDLVKFTGDFQPVANQLFSDVWIVDDLLTALDLWRSNRSAEPPVRRGYVTLEGELVDADGVVTGGSRDVAGAGIFEQKRELRELDEMLIDLEANHSQANATHVQLKNELAALSKSLETVQKDSHQSEMEILTREKDLSREREELERLNARMEVLGRDQNDLGEAVTQASREVEEARIRLGQARDRLVTLEDQLSGSAHRQLELLERVESSQEALTAARVELAQGQEKSISLTRTLERLFEEQADKAGRMERLRRGIQEGQTRAADLEADVALKREELIALVEGRSGQAETLTVARGKYEADRNDLGTHESALKSTRSELENLTQEMTRAELKRHDLHGARMHLEETIAERYRMILAEQVHDHHMRPLVTEAEEKRLKELKELIERMGEINLNAIEEYNTLETRYTFLTGQKTDLESALTQLDEAIAKINRTSKKRFREVFDLVNAKFQEIFPRCFKGGHGRLVLTDEENLLESGIEIIAQPPGKKNTTVEVLSGGEKAMTAVALIFAIFLIKPSPFCLLDEVDAPLDEANVGRYNDLVKEMTDRSQFIIITHNKRTMQVADTLYGVTMEEPGISKLVSVNLNAVGKDTAERNRAKAGIVAA